MGVYEGANVFSACDALCGEAEQKVKQMTRSKLLIGVNTTFSSVISLNSLLKFTPTRR